MNVEVRLLKSDTVDTIMSFHDVMVHNPESKAPQRWDVHGNTCVHEHFDPEKGANVVCGVKVSDSLSNHGWLCDKHLERQQKHRS